MIRTEIVKNAVPDPRSGGQIAREFTGLIASGMPVLPAGPARRDPAAFIAHGNLPRARLELFDTVFYLTGMREDESLGFFVAYVCAERPRRAIYPRIFYKDLSLVWRSATHVIRSEDENWIGKGDLIAGIEDGEEILYSAESTTDLPFEIQVALDEISRRARPRRDLQSVAEVLRNAPDDRLAPYRDFTEPRRRAMADPRNLPRGGRPIARFARKNDPTSLTFASGYAPDFARGFVDEGHSKSRLYHGEIVKRRILSENRRIQYLFLAGPDQVWIAPPQALTTEISSYGVRTVDVNAPEELFVPGYEYHYIDDDEDPPQLHTQIPPGFAGQPSEIDPARADASPWLDRLPAVRAYRRRFEPRAKGRKRARRS